MLIDTSPVAAKSCDLEGGGVEADLLVSELLDTALLGEGVLLSHADAISRGVRTKSLT